MRLFFFEEEKKSHSFKQCCLCHCSCVSCSFLPRVYVAKKEKKKELLNLTSLVFEKHCDSCSFVFLFLLLFW